MVRPHSPSGRAGSLRGLDGAATARNHTARAGPVACSVELLSRVFKVDVLKCENCGGRMTVLAFVTGRAVVNKILEHLGLGHWAEGASTRGRTARAGRATG
jgi:hypothetical protein